MSSGSQKINRIAQLRPKGSQPFSPAGEGLKTSQAARHEAAEYIAHMSAGLADIATSAQLELVSYFLKMAQMQAKGFLQGEE
jgi:hypothetical protein